MKIIDNVFTELNKNNLQGYVITHGNRQNGKLVQKDELTFYWRQALNLSKSIHYGDCSLYYNSKNIRTIANMDVRILDKTKQYEYLTFK
jgi:hypothetical protein